MRNVLLGTLLVGGALALTGSLAGADLGVGVDSTSDATDTAAPDPTPDPTTDPTSDPLVADADGTPVPAGREVLVAWGTHEVASVAMTPDRAIFLRDFLVGRDRGVVLAWPGGAEFGYLYPVGGTLPSGRFDRVEQVTGIDDLADQLTDHDRFPDVYVRPVGGTVVEGYRETLILDVTTRAIATKDPRPVLRVAPIDAAETTEAVGVGPIRGATERSWIVDVDGRPWALTVDGDDPEAIAAGEELALSLRFHTTGQTDVPQP